MRTETQVHIRTDEDAGLDYAYPTVCQTLSENPPPTRQQHSKNGAKKSLSQYRAEKTPAEYTRTTPTSQGSIYSSLKHADTHVAVRPHMCLRVHKYIHIHI